MVWVFTGKRRSCYCPDFMPFWLHSVLLAQSVAGSILDSVLTCARVRSKWESRCCKSVGVSGECRLVSWKWGTVRKEAKNLGFVLWRFEDLRLWRYARKSNFVALRYVLRSLKKSEETGSLSRHSGSGGPTKITTEIKSIVEQQMQRNDETTAV